MSPPSPPFPTIHIRQKRWLDASMYLRLSASGVKAGPFKNTLQTKLTLVEKEKRRTLSLFFLQRFKSCWRTWKWTRASGNQFQLRVHFVSLCLSPEICKVWLWALSFQMAVSVRSTSCCLHGNVHSFPSEVLGHTTEPTLAGVLLCPRMHRLGTGYVWPNLHGKHLFFFWLCFPVKIINPIKSSSR